MKATLWNKLFARARRKVRDLDDDSRWALRQAIAEPNAFYGLSGTIHHTTQVDIEVHEGRVVSVWFRCLPIAFKQHDVDAGRGREMEQARGAPIVGVEYVPAQSGDEVDEVGSTSEK